MVRFASVPRGVTGGLQECDTRRVGMRASAIVAACAVLGGLLCDCNSDEKPCSPVHRCVTVKPDGSGDYPTIQAAIEAAEDGEVIELASGVFTGPGNRDLDNLGKAITIRSATGDPEQCWIDCENSGSRGIDFHSGEGRGSILEGVTIRRGAMFWASGAAVRCISASPTFIRCVFRENSALVGGAALSCAHSSPLFIECEFERNLGNQGTAAVDLFECQSVVLIDCRFSENQADAGGTVVGAIRSSLEMIGCTCLGNGTNGMGGALWTVESSVVLERCVIVGSYAGYYGSCLSAWGGSVVIRHCTVSGSQSPADGGALCAIQGGRLLVEGSILAFGGPGPSVACVDSSQIEVRCSDVFGNWVGDWVGCLEGQLGVDGNFSADPRFCDLEGGDFHLGPESRCAPDSNSACGLVGALQVGCQVSPTGRSLAGR